MAQIVSFVAPGRRCCGRVAEVALVDAEQQEEARLPVVAEPKPEAKVIALGDLLVKMPAGADQTISVRLKQC